MTDEVSPVRIVSNTVPEEPAYCFVITAHAIINKFVLKNFIKGEVK